MGTIFKRKQAAGGRARKWCGEYRDGDGKVRRVALSTDKGIAKRMLDALERRAERERAGFVDRYDSHRLRPIAEHLADYHAYLAAKGGGPDHVARQVRRIESAVVACNLTRLRDLEASPVAAWLAGRRAAGDLGKVASNNYVGALKGFSRWLQRERRTPDDPLVGLRKLNPSDDLRRPRRVLSDEELARLLEAAKRSERSRCGRAASLQGQDRYSLYLLAAFTGLRAGELASIRPMDLNLDSVPPTLKVRARISKNSREAVLPLHPEVADVFRGYLSGRPTDRAIWPGRWHRRAAEMLRFDLAAAGIEYVDGEGEFFDFHSLRGQFCTALALADVAPKIAQELARHSTPMLTFGLYAKVKGAASLAPALSKLRLPGARTEKMPNSTSGPLTRVGGALQVPSLLSSAESP